MVAHVEIFTDGACKGNPGPGGWAALLRFKEHEKVISGGCEMTTNNRMEMIAAIQALESLKRSCLVTLTTDSLYLMKGVTEWMPAWKKRNWQTSQKKPVKNQDLWIKLDAALAKHQVAWKWVRGHADHDDNNQVDRLARAESEKFCYTR